MTIDFIVPEAQYPKAFAGKVLVASHVTPSMRIKIVLAAIHFNDEAVFETYEIDDIAVPWSLATEVETLLFPQTQVNPQFYFLWTHSFAQLTRDLVCHFPHPAAFGGHPPPSGEGSQPRRLAVIAPGISAPSSSASRSSAPSSWRSRSTRRAANRSDRNDPAATSRSVRR
jgi:hypothetical protein